MDMRKRILMICLLIGSFAGNAQKAEKEATIETPDLHVLYEGIPIELKASANGDYKKVTMSVPSPFTAAPGTAGQTIVITLTGTDSKGNAVSLGSKKFMVKKAPKPELFWNGIGEGGRAMKSGGSLHCAYGNNVPFLPSKGMFSILSYSIRIAGVKGSLEGAGSSISAAHLQALRGITEGKIHIQVNYSGSGSGRVSATFN
jgi:hypothetical protein